MTHFHVGYNMPGYLPENTPVCADSAEWAMQIWHGEVHTAADELPDDGDFLDIDTQQALVTVADLLTHGGVSQDVGNYTYWVEPADGEQSVCDLADSDY